MCLITDLVERTGPAVLSVLLWPRASREQGWGVLPQGTGPQT